MDAQVQESLDWLVENSHTQMAKTILRKVAAAAEDAPDGLLEVIESSSFSNIEKLTDQILEAVRTHDWSKILPSEHKYG